MNELLQQLKAADRVCQSANEHYVKADQMESQISEVNGKIKKAKIKWIAIGLIAWWFFGGIISMIYTAINIMIIQLIGVILIIVGIVMDVKFCRGKYIKEKEGFDSEIANIQRQVQAERNIGQQIFEDNIAAMEFLPSDYWYPMATDYLVKTVQTGRASTLAEALDKFEEQLHRWKIEEANSQMVAMQQQQTAYLSSIKTSSKVSAAANVANAFINLSSKM